MQAKKKTYRIRNTSKPEKQSEGTEEVHFHYLSFWRNGLRIMVTKFLPTGEVHIALIRGKDGSASFKEFKRHKLQVPSQHQIDVLVATLVKNVGLFI